MYVIHGSNNLGKDLTAMKHCIYLLKNIKVFVVIKNSDK